MSIYKSCEWIEHGVVLDHCNIVRVCSLYNSDKGGRPVIWEKYLGTTDWNDFLKIKNEHRAKFKNGGCLDECKDCMMLKDREWDEEDYIDRILLTPWIECNSKCIYCGAPSDGFTLQNTTKYNVTNVISSMIEHNVLLKTANIDFAGGEPTMYEDFEELLSLFIKNGFKDIVIHTSAIKFSSSIEKGVSEGIIRLLVSIDAGTKEMHQTVKGVDSYDDVWSNLSRYVRAQKNNSGQIRTKYIIIPGVNDTESQIDIWLNKCLSVGIDSVALNIDHNWVSDNLTRINLMPMHDLMSYTVNRTKELKMRLELYPQINQIKYKVEEDLTNQLREGK